ncbi:UDP-N-acetylmuramoyl-L-alanyl-D-glutamate--2,6-diaminopimelate ligase [Propionivibrio sp.]|uniref:UDP-N-acetylmuramoyl-L-alanyl-D-glutamate--2, 6-diaminopimelate ligase n=1 Tax=Propionivibrio sp. TaxID=2212460 RepID=UPI0025E253EF|nr:UDP-N-acetylmuramoyl-L-alanyl-D-glutamate--2,6-diaminopimelate ligase [Propionivibrio sp.]
MSSLATSSLAKSPDAIIQQLAALGVQPGGVADDSRQVRPGDLFVAFPGDLADGRRYIADAIARGACAVLWEAEGDFVWNPDWKISNLPATRVRALAGPLAHALFGQPSERLSLIAITGTNGKTTISQWIAHAYPRLCAIIGTLGAGFPDQLLETGFTTPEAATLTRYLAEFAAAEAQACALEASSIGIEEGRLDGARIDVAVFTNLTHDHLDYHGTMENYAAAKERLFIWPRLRLAVINLDDPFGRELVGRCTAARILGYTQSEAPSACQGVIRAENVEETIHGLRFTLCAPNGRAPVESGLLGRFNVSNLLAVAAVLIDAGLSPEDVADRFAKLTSPPGRLEKVVGRRQSAAQEQTLGGSLERDNEPMIIVDYAHTPDALERALRALRPVARARGASLVALFGCGGDRDRGKRPLMGKIAAQLADRVVLTSDNPRSEQPSAILDEIRIAAPGAELILDRAQAIRQTILAAHPADVILLAGKGHETYQEIAGVRCSFSDIAEASAALAARLECMS